MELRIDHPCATALATSMGRTRRAARSKENPQFRFQGGDHDPFYPILFRATAKLLEIVRSLIFANNSSRKFQTHISNSGEQIPKHARQNSEDCRFPVSRNKVRSRGHRFLGTDFSILVSEFKFPPLSRIWDASHFSFLDSRCESKDAHGLEIAQFQFLISRFTILVSKRPLHITNPLVPHFSFLVSGVSKEPSFHGI